MVLEIEKDFAGSQIVGARSYQEDAQGFASLREDEKGNVQYLLTVLADGMGGENAGGHASKSVVQTFVDYCCELDLDAAEIDIPKMLKAAMLAANQGLATEMEQDNALAGMGCTLLACVVVDYELYWISVGDSPLYLYRKGRCLQINQDHSMLPVLRELVHEGKIHPNALKNHPDRNVLRSAMIGGELELVDSPSVGLALQPGDMILVASDGIQTLDEASIETRLDRHQKLPADAMARKLLTAVKRAGNPRQDNTSINVIRIPDPENDLPVGEEDKLQTRIIRRD